MPLPALHERFVPAAAKMASTPELSLRGPEGAVAISGRQRRSLYKAAAREKNVAALSERHASWQSLRHAFCGARPSSLSLRGPKGAVAISGRHWRFAQATVKMVCTDCVCSGAQRAPWAVANMEAFPANVQCLQVCHCEAPKGPWQSREGSFVFADGFLAIRL